MTHGMARHLLGVYVALLQVVAIIAWLNLPHRYHRGWLPLQIYFLGYVCRISTLGPARSSRSRTAWRMVRYASSPGPTPLANVCHVAPPLGVASTVSANVSSAGLSCPPTPTSPSNSAAAFLDFRSSNRSLVLTPGGASSRVAGDGRLYSRSGGSRGTSRRASKRSWDPICSRVDEGTPRSRRTKLLG